MHCQVYNIFPYIKLWETFSVLKGKLLVAMETRLLMGPYIAFHPYQPEDHWSCIAHLIAEDILKSAVIEEKTFKHSPWAGADNP